MQLTREDFNAPLFLNCSVTLILLKSCQWKKLSSTRNRQLQHLGTTARSFSYAIVFEATGVNTLAAVHGRRRDFAARSEAEVLTRAPSAPLRVPVAGTHSMEVEFAAASISSSSSAAATSAGIRSVDAASVSLVTLLTASSATRLASF